MKGGDDRKSANEVGGGGETLVGRRATDSMAFYLSPVCGRQVDCV